MNMTLFFIAFCIGLVVFLNLYIRNRTSNQVSTSETGKSREPPVACGTQSRMEEDIRAVIPGNKKSPNRGVGKSIVGALAVLFWDVALSGSFAMSFLVCPNLVYCQYPKKLDPASRLDDRSD